MAHTQTETQPRKRPPTSAEQRVKLSVAQRAYVAHDPRWSEHRRKLAAAQEAKRMTLFDNEVAAIVALRRKGRTFSYIAEEIGVCRDVIGRELRARGIDTSPIKADRRAHRGGFLAVLRRLTIRPTRRPDDRQAGQKAWWANAGAVNRLPHRGACQSRRIGLLRRRSPVRRAAALAGAADPGTIARIVNARGRVRRKVARRSQLQVQRDEHCQGQKGLPAQLKQIGRHRSCATLAAYISKRATCSRTNR
jgi:hypothetical protein